MLCVPSTEWYFGPFVCLDLKKGGMLDGREVGGHIMNYGDTFESAVVQNDSANLHNRRTKISPMA